MGKGKGKRGATKGKKAKGKKGWLNLDDDIEEDLLPPENNEEEKKDAELSPEEIENKALEERIAKEKAEEWERKRKEEEERIRRENTYEGSFFIDPFVWMFLIQY